jgi:hypothetical protein
VGSSGPTSALVDGSSVKIACLWVWLAMAALNAIFPLTPGNAARLGDAPEPAPMATAAVATHAVHIRTTLPVTATHRNWALTGKRQCYH